MKKSLPILWTIAILLISCQNDYTLPGAEEIYNSSQTSATQIITSGKCKKFGETVYNEFIKTYNNQGCKLAVLSPDGKYLAYVTLSKQSDAQGTYYTDSVMIISQEENNSVTELHTALRKNYVEKLEWNPYNNGLMIWESIWEDDWALFIYHASTGQELAKMRTDSLNLQWNSKNTAFYVTHVGKYGKDVCVSELSGFDFQTNRAFPNLLDVFNINKYEKDLLGTPYATEDALKVVPYNWSPDGKEVRLAVTPLHWLGNDLYEYELKPIQVGALQLTDTTISYTTLASDPNLNYFFEENTKPIINSKPYKNETCPQK